MLTGKRCFFSFCYVMNGAHSVAKMEPKRYRYRLIYLDHLRSLEWRNWQTHGTQNPAGFTSHVGSTPTSSTNNRAADHIHSQNFTIGLYR